MDSMYGGQAGASFVLSGNFSSINAMVEAFKKGPVYTDVWYNQYVLIDTPNKNDADNGKIYRRGLNYTNDLGGAEYFGQIVGPSSGTPYLEMKNLEELRQIKRDTDDGLDGNEPVHRSFPIDEKDKDGLRIYGFEYKEDVKDDQGNDIPLGGGLVPGKDENGEFNDKIKFSWVNIRKDNADSDSIYYVGFEFPYLVTDLITTTVSQYGSNGAYTKNSATIKRTDKKDHPYYNQWTIGVPKGIKGDSIRNVRVITLDPEAAADEKILDPALIKIDSITGEVIEYPNENYAGYEDDKKAGYKIVVADFYTYDKESNPSAKTIYLGDFNVIKDINLSKDGVLKIDCTHSESFANNDNKIYWAKEVKLFEKTANDYWKNSNGEYVTFNAGDFVIFWNSFDFNGGYTRFKVDWPTDIKIDNDGVVTVNHFDGTTEQQTGKDALRWVNGASLSTGNGSGGGTFTVNYNNPSYDKDGNEIAGSESKDFSMRWINDIQVEDDGSIAYTYSGTGAEHGDNKENSEGLLKESEKIRWIDKISLNPDDGKFNITYNNNTKPFPEQQLEWVKDISFDTSNGRMTIEKTTKSVSVDKVLKLLTNMSVTKYDKDKKEDGGKIRLTYNTTEANELPEYLKIEGESKEDFVLKGISEVKLNTGIWEDKHLQIQYTNNDNYISLGNSINSIECTAVDPITHHLYILFSDKDSRADIAKDENGQEQIITNGTGTKPTDWVTTQTLIQDEASIPSKYSTSANLTLCWKDCGAIKDDAGVLVGGYFTKTEVEKAGAKNATAFLTSLYQNGRPDGKIMIYDTLEGSGDEGSTKKIFYAFDYGYTGAGTNIGWKEIGSLTSSAEKDAILDAEGAADTALNKLGKGGVFFVYGSLEKSSTGMPEYWKPASVATGEQI